MKTIYETTAMLTNTRSEVAIEAEIDNVRETLKVIQSRLMRFLQATKSTCAGMVKFM